MTNLQNYILSCVDGEGYDKVLKTKSAKIHFVMDCFNSEYLHANNRTQYRRDPAKVLGEWLSGLPSSINIVFYNFDILNMAVLFDLIPANATEEQEDIFLNEWFKLIATQLLEMKRPQLV